MLNDGKFHSSHLEQAGFQLMPRSQFNALLKRQSSPEPKTAPWTVDDTLDVGTLDPAGGPEQFAEQAG